MTRGRYDVVIIGSGISSLTCAALLSKKGRSVCVLESHTKPGGYLHCFSRFGARFDTGAHYVGAMGPGQPFRRVLQYMGVYRDDLFIELDREGFDVLRFPKFEISIPSGYPLLIERLVSRFPRERAAIETYFKTMHEVANNFPTYKLSDDIDQQKLLKALETPLQTFVESLTTDPVLKLVFYSYCVLHGVNPGDVAVGTHAIVTDSLVQGAYGLRRGGDLIAKSFVEQIRLNGGEVLLKSRVVGIETKGGVATAVLTAKGERIEADWIISGIHPKTTFGMVDDQSAFTAAAKERLLRTKESIGFFGLYGQRRAATGIHPLRNYYYFDTDDAAQVMQPQPRLERPRALFLSPAHREADPGVGCLPVNVHAAGPFEWFSEWEGSKFNDRPDAYSVAKDAYAQKVIDLVDREQQGFRDSLIDYETSTPLTNLHFNGTPEGSAYGIYHSIQNTGARALGPRTKIPNLLLTGQNTLFPGIQAGAIAGLRTSGHILGIKPMLAELGKGAS